MDFDFLTDIPLPFADDSDQDGGELETARQLRRPLLHQRRAAKREFRAALHKEALTEIIPTLPDQDVDLYVVSNGSGSEIRHGTNPLAFSFGDFIPHLCRMLGNKQCTAYISTWTCARSHTLTMLEMSEDERLAALTFCSDPYFSRREAAIYAEFVTGLNRYPGRTRYMAWKNHCKLICISNPDGQCCTITGSANLSAQPRCEQYVLTTGRDVYSFFVTEFFEEMLNGREANQSSRD